MKIVHICLACFYVEGMGYQENMLPIYHKRMGMDVTVITSDYAFNAKSEVVKKELKEYVNEYGVKVLVLERSKRYGYLSRFNDYEKVYETLTDESPDIIFIHGGHFIAIKDVVKYVKKHKNVRIYVDQHSDYYNAPVDTIKRKIVAKWLYGTFMRMAVPYVNTFWGVTPWRCEYLRDVFGIPENKIKLLVMGGDSNNIRFEKKQEIRKEIRAKLDIKPSDFVFISGGKINRGKNIHLLLEAMSEINRPGVVLILFGESDAEMEETIHTLANQENVRYLGWLKACDVYDYILASDMAIFPGTHSVLWEQTCACGIPGMFKDWEGMHHVNVNGSAMFIKSDTEEEIKSSMIEILDSPGKYSEMAKAAAEFAVKEFSYRDIAKRAIEWNIEV